MHNAMRPQFAGVGFDGIAWRESLADVREVHAEEPVREDANMLVYEDWLLGWPCHRYFVFEDGLLTQGRYILQTADPRETQWAYSLLRAELTKQCGPQLDRRQLMSLSGASPVVTQSCGQPICLFQPAVGTQAILSLIAASDDVVDVHLRYVDETCGFMRVMKARYPDLF